MQQTKRNGEGGPSSIVSVPSHSSSTHEDEIQSESTHPSLDCCKLVYFYFTIVIKN